MLEIGKCRLWESAEYGSDGKRRLWESTEYGSDGKVQIMGLEQESAEYGLQSEGTETPQIYFFQDHYLHGTN